MVTKEFELLDTTADKGLIAYGHDLKEAFINAAKGLLSIITEPKLIKDLIPHRVEINAKDLTGLLVCWLNEIIYLQEVDEMLYKRFEIKKLEKDYLEAEIWGERFNPDKHLIKGEVKAATYHRIGIKEEKGIWEIAVIFDV